jgi:hypothetical protein
MDAKAIVGLLQYMTGGLILGLAVWGFITKKIVPWWAYEAALKEKNEYRSRLFARVDPDYKPPLQITQGAQQQ